MAKKKSLLIILAILGCSALVFSQFLGSNGAGKNAGNIDPEGQGAVKTGSTADGSATKLTVQVSMNEQEYASFSEMAAQFDVARADVEMQVENVSPDEAYGKWKKMSQMGEAPDLMLIDNNWVYEFAALGFLQPVDEFFPSDTQNGRIELLMNQVKWNGYIWGIPKDVDPYILAWNKAKALEFGKEAAPKTAEELMAWNAAMMVPEENRYGIYYDPADPYAFIALASSLTGSWLSEQSWNDPSAIAEKLSAFLAPQEQEWAGAAFPKNYPAAVEGLDVWKQLEEGHIAGLVTTVSEYKKHESAAYTMSALPPVTLDADYSVWMRGRSFVISSKSEHADLMMDWLKQLTDPESEVSYWEQTKMLPTQIPTFQLAPLHSDEHIASYDWLIRKGKVLKPSADTPKKLEVLKGELDKLYTGGIPIKKFVDTLLKEWTHEERLPGVR